MKFNITISGEASAEEVVAIMKEAENQMIARDERWKQKCPPAPSVGVPESEVKGQS